VQRALLLVALALVAAALAVPSAQSAATPSQLSVTVVRAFFAGKYETIWANLHPRYRAATTKAHFLRCQAQQGKALAPLKLRSVEATTTEAGTVEFPPLGQTSVVVVNVALTFTDPKAQRIANAVYWTRLKSRWVGLWTPSSYAAFKAGRCP
jgi:hypothetical protein